MEPRKTFSQTAYFRYSSMAFQMAATIGIFVFAGYELDKYLKLKGPYCTIALSLVGVGLSLYSVIRDFIKPQK